MLKGLAHSRPGGTRNERAPALRAAILLLAGLAAATLAGPFDAAAAPSGDFPQVRGISMLVSPPRLVVPSGQANKVQRLEVENRGTVPLTVHAETLAIVQNANGTASPEPSGPYSAAKWVKVTPDHFTISRGARKFIQIRIHVPPHAEPGDHDLTINLMIPPGPTQGQRNIRVSEGIGIPTLITVPGRVVDDLGITQITAPGFSGGGSIAISATVRESGDVHHSFRGNGQQLTANAAGTPVPFPPATVLRQSTIRLTTSWHNPPAVCLCHISVAITVGGHHSQATATVLILPVKPALTGLGALGTIALTLLLARRMHRRKLKAAYEAGRRARPDDRIAEPS